MTLLGKPVFSKGLSGACPVARCRSGALVGGSAGVGGGVSTFPPSVMSQRASLQEAVGTGDSFQRAACLQGLSHTFPPPSLPPVTQIPSSLPQSLGMLWARCQLDCQLEST